MCQFYRKPSTVTYKGKRENQNAKIRITQTRTSIIKHHQITYSVI
jgi:hypothetical protein